jgi:hypothetical protein
MIPRLWEENKVVRWLWPFFRILVYVSNCASQLF